jgi:Holliday junction resolvase RusA-like endonuclease
MVTVTFDVAGTVAGKGSKSAFVVRRKGAVGEGSRAYRAIVTDKIDKSKVDRFGEWKRAVTDEAITAMCDESGVRRLLLDGPLAIVATFYFAPPKHETKAQRARVWHTTPIDIDKCVRALLDPLTGIVFTDDSRVAHLVASKRYARDREPGVSITISQIAEGD